MRRTHPTTATAKTHQQPATQAAEGEFSWRLTQHACRVCFGRILMRETFDRRRVYRCSCCDIEAEGHSEKALCCCGLKLKTGIDAGVRCAPATNRSPEFPAAITATQISVLEEK